jgi:hypothetical protein
VNPEPTWALYDALADVAGVSRPLRCNDARVSCATLRLAEGDLAVVTNLSADAVSAELVSSGEGAWEDVFTGEKWGAAAMALAPYEVRASAQVGHEPGGGQPLGGEYRLAATMNEQRGRQR